VVCLDETPQGTTQPQVVGYLNIFLKKTKNITQVKMEGYLKNSKKINKETTPQLGVVGYNKDKSFVTFEGTLQLGVEWYQKNLKK